MKKGNAHRQNIWSVLDDPIPNKKLRGRLKEKTSTVKSPTAGYMPPLRELFRMLDWDEVMQTYVGWKHIAQYTEELQKTQRGTIWVIQKMVKESNENSTWKLNTYACNQEVFDVCYAGKIPKLISMIYMFNKFHAVGDKHPYAGVPTIFIAKHQGKYKLFDFNCESLVNGEVLQLQEIIAAMEKK